MVSIAHVLEDEFVTARAGFAAALLMVKRWCPRGQAPELALGREWERGPLDRWGLLLAAGRWGLWSLERWWWASRYRVRSYSG